VDNITKFICPHCNAELGADLSMLEADASIQVECPFCQNDLIVSTSGETLPFDPETRERILSNLDMLSDSPLRIGLEETMLNLVKYGDGLDSVLSVDENVTNLLCLDDETLVEDMEYLLTLSNIKFSTDITYLLGKFYSTGKLGKFERDTIEECYKLAYSVGMRE